MTLDEARVRGFDPEAILSGVEGRYEADVRWDRPFNDPNTHVRVEIARDGTANILGWDCQSGGYYKTTCYAGNLLALNVRVSVSTSDGRLAGSFVGSLDAASGSVSRSDWNGATRLSAGTELSAIRGTLDVGPVQPTERLGGELMILVAPGAAPRIQIRVTVVDGNTTEREFYALPLDGCNVWAGFVAPGEPLTAFAPPNGDCSPAHFGPGSCCLHLPEWKVPYPIAEGTDRSCGAHANADHDAGQP